MKQSVPGYIVWADAITPLGNHWNATWTALLGGVTAVDNWRSDEAAYEVNARVATIDSLERGIDSDGNSSAYRLGRQLAQRIASANFGDFPLFGAANHGDSDLVMKLGSSLDARESHFPAALWVGLLADQIPQAFQTTLAGWNSSACSSGLHAVVDAMMELRYGDSAFAVAAGLDALSPIGIAGFARAGACGTERSRPFGRERDGLAIGEAAAALAIGREPQGALAAIVGIGMSCDAWHATDPDPTGAGLERAIRQALDSAGVAAPAVAAIVSHGTATKKNDAIEAIVINRVWPDAQVAVTSLKHCLGHPMGAAGLINLICAAQGSYDGCIPPVSTERFQGEPGIDLIVGEPRAIPRGAPVLAVASGFGGNNVAVLIRGAGP